jgi:hypothetical protein
MFCDVREDILVLKPTSVEKLEKLEIYPDEPRPITVELIGAPKLWPLMVDTWMFCVESAWKRPKPATSKAIPAVVVVLIPTLELISMTMAGIRLLVILEDQRREEDPGSNTMLPVV